MLDAAIGGSVEIVQFLLEKGLTIYDTDDVRTSEDFSPKKFKFYNIFIEFWNSTFVRS